MIDSFKIKYLKFIGFRDYYISCIIQERNLKLINKKKVD